MTFFELLDYYHKLSQLEATNLSEKELTYLSDWAVRGYDDGEFPTAKGHILRLVCELRELRSAAAYCKGCGNMPELFLENIPFCKKCADLFEQNRKRREYEKYRREE